MCGVCSHQVLVLFIGHFALIIGLYFRLYSCSPRLFGAASIAIVSPGAVDSFRSSFIQKICLGYTLVDDWSFLVSVPSTCCLHCFVAGSCGYCC